MKFWRIAKGLTLALGLLCLGLPASAQTIVLGGSSYGRLASSLTTLGKSYTLGGATPSPAGLGAGDIIIMGFNGGGQFLPDYREFLNNGGHLIVAGSSNNITFSAWQFDYMNLDNDDRNRGIHNGGAWHNVGSHRANQFLPSTYNFENSDANIHTFAFTTTPNTTMYGTNDEGVSIGAFRTYNNGGTLNFLALMVNQWGSAADEANFTTPWLRSALEATIQETPPGDPSAVPEPSAVLLFLPALGVAMLARRKRAA